MKAIDKFLGKDKKSEVNAAGSRPEAMTLEEMAVKVQERKILGPERKVDMNIIMFVALCLSGLVIINVILYFLIGESNSSLQPIQPAQDARGLLKERREESASLLDDLVQTDSDVGISNISEGPPSQELLNEEPSSQGVLTEQMAMSDEDAFTEAAEEPVQENLNDVDVDVEVDVEVDVTALSVVNEGAPLLEEPLFAGDSLLAENTLLAEGSSLAGGSTTVDKVITSVQEEQEEIPFDMVISVGSTINDWAAAWSAQDVDAYLSYYSNTFFSEAGMNIEEWRAHRAIRLIKPEWISIGVDKLRISATDDGAKAEFIQEYNASNYSDKEYKIMIFKKANNEWKIFDERATQVE